MSENVEAGANAGTEEKTKKHKWYTFSQKKGTFLLGTLVAIGAFGLSMKQPSAEFTLDTKGVASFVRCSGSLNAGEVSETDCRDYFETYLNKRISETDNLPKIVPVDIIGATYSSPQLAFEAKGLQPLTSLEELTNNKIQVLKSGKTITAS
ncbi:hypothetical protein [Vibrio atlanticus]|uniref:hypothetical protein n=1 Tax=Vibrio atlanticus TaxID=693153 RepID=UPI0022AE723F|nr:hypothetical protein [Vibrio atlanticus]MCZ4311052.1 hypothetical protein [Vibrio atlanticus]